MHAINIYDQSKQMRKNLQTEYKNILWLFKIYYFGIFKVQ